MPLSQQPKLLRTLQERKINRVGEVEERPVNFRTISATHRDLRKAATEGQFREDLFYRISKATVTLPALRERIEDVRELTESFLLRHTKRYEITEDAMNLLLSYNWPGNVRQLEAVLEGMIIRANDGTIRIAQVVQTIPELAGLSPSKIKKAVVGSYGIQLIAKERSRFERAIIEANGDRTLAAKNLGLPRTTFFRKAKELGLVRSRQERSLVGINRVISIPKV
jgi:transcriptional regulator with PAS, ATPase and Fis domain